MRFNLPREFYLPSSEIPTLKIKKDGIVAEAYIYNNSGTFYAIGFSGKKQKPDFHHRFHNGEQQKKHIDDWFKSLASRNEYKMKKRNERKEFKTTLKKDDILMSSWGYDQTNIDYYQVLEVSATKKSVKIRKIGYGKYEQTGYMTGTCGPAKDCFFDSKGRAFGEVMTKKVSPGDSISLTSFSSAWKVSPNDTHSWSSYA